jgi:RNA polymerase sigma-70 factor (ECF subfamily)
MRRTAALTEMDGWRGQKVPALSLTFFSARGNQCGLPPVYWVFGSRIAAERQASCSAGKGVAVDDLKWAIARQIPHLRRFALALTKDQPEADDVVQDCLERALKKRFLWRRKGSLRSWLFSMLYRMHIDHRRSRRRSELSVGPEAIDAVVSHAPNQEHRLECRDIGEAIDRLPDEQRDVVLLVALEGVAYDEAAEILNVPIGTIRSRLSRGRQTLRRLRSPATRQRILRRVK